MADDFNIIPSYVGGRYGQTATRNKQPFAGIVMHVTGKPDLQSELDYMGKQDPNRPGQYGYHFLIDRDGKVYQTAPYDVRTNHILPNSQYGLSNNNALGIALVGADKGTTPEQITSGTTLANQLQSQFQIDPKNIVSHGELDPETRGAGKGLNPEGGSEGQDFINAYRGGQPQPTATAGPSAPARPATATPGAAFTSPMDLVANLESGNRNIPQAIKDINTARGTPAGGYFQIIDPTWQRYAGAAGVDVRQFPTAMSAPRDVQAKVAGAIPVNQWGPNTVAALKAQYPGIDTSQTLGAIQSKALGGAGTTAMASAAPIGTTLTSAGPGAPGATLPGFGTAQASGEFTKGLSQLDKALGGKGLQGQQGQGGQDQIRPPMMPGPPPAMNVSQLIGQSPAMMMRLSGYTPSTTYGQTLTSMQDPMQGGWGSAPASPVAPAATGTSLNSLQALAYQDPMTLAMMHMGMGMGGANSFGGMGYGS